MKLVTFVAGGATRLGAFHDGRCVDLNAAAALGQDGRPALASDMKELLALGGEGLARARRLLAAALAAEPVAAAGVVFDRDDVVLLAPVPRPGKLLAIGQNYRDHCEEQGAPLPEAVAVFSKFPTAVIGDRAPIRLPSVTVKPDYEAELAVVIGLGGRNIPEADAYDHIAGYTCANDVSARDLQFGDGRKQWVRGKGLDTFAPLGPWLVTRDEIPDPHALPIACHLNGVTMQQSNTSNLVFRIPYLVSELSRGLALEPGDVIITGTPGGVGVFRDPPVFLKPGDEVVIAIEGIGELTNPVVAGD